MKDYGTPDMLDLLREAVSIGAHGEVWHHRHMLWAQSMGRHKRLNRCESGKDRAHYIKLQNYCLDMFGEVVEPDWDYTVDKPEDIKGRFSRILPALRNKQILRFNAKNARYCLK